MTDNTTEDRSDPSQVDPPAALAAGSNIKPRVAALESEVRALESKVAGLLAAGRSLESDVRELIHDITALALLAGQIFGEPFRSNAAAIVTKRQTG